MEGCFDSRRRKYMGRVSPQAWHSVNSWCNCYYFSQEWETEKSRDEGQFLDVQRKEAWGFCSLRAKQGRDQTDAHRIWHGTFPALSAYRILFSWLTFSQTPSLRLHTIWFLSTRVIIKVKLKIKVPGNIHGCLSFDASHYCCTFWCGPSCIGECLNRRRQFILLDNLMCMWFQTQARLIECTPGDQFCLPPGIVSV